MAETMHPIEYFICGGVGGLGTVLVGHPMDTIKVRLQTMNIKPGEKPPFTGTWNCCTKTLKNEGPRGFFKGMSLPLVGVTPIFAIFFLGYGLGKRLFKTYNEDYRDLRTFAAGGFSGIFTTIATAPGERVKCLLQVQLGENKKYSGPVHVLKQLYLEGGIRSIFRGSVATMMRDGPASGVFFLAYAKYTQILGKTEIPTMFVTILAGGFSGISAWIVGMPFDTLKSRIQTAPEGTYPGGLKQVFFELMKKDGPTGLYKGFVPVIIRAFPANAACFLGFEVAASSIKKLKETAGNSNFGIK